MLASGPLAARQAPAPLAQCGMGVSSPLTAPAARQPAGLARLRRPSRGVGCRPSRRALLTAAALQREGESLALPLNYFKLLGVSGVCSRDTLARALEKALTQPPSVGYSQQCLLARGSVLKRAVETLLDPQGRKAYDEALVRGEITEDVPDEFVPGVLALLVEAGEAQTVVAAGEEWLATHRRDPRVRDVALSTALAHMAVAEQLGKKQGDVAAAVSMLEVAGELLRRHRGTPQLQADVTAELAALQPALAAQLVALPLERFQERERGVQIAIRVLTDNSGARRGMGKQEFLNRMADSLTAEEQISVYEAAGSRYAELPSELYDVALAYIADATANARPEQLERALGALTAAARATPPGATGQEGDSGLRQLAERRAIDERNRRQVAYAVCQLLLGDTAAAADTLGLSPGSDIKCDRTMLAFIKANSPDREDLLPGLCVLGQRWVADVALGSFRGSQGTPFSLESWFEQDAVKRYVARRGLAGPPPTSPLVAAAERAGALLLSPLVAGMAGVLSLAGLLSDPEAEERQRQQRAEEEEARLAEMEASAAAATSAAAANAGLATTAAAAVPEAAQQAARAMEQAAVEQEQERQVPAGRSPAEALQAAAAPDMAEVDMRAQRSAALRARKPPAPVTPEELKPRHTARPELTAAANALHAPPPPPKPMPPPVPEAAEGEDFDANVALSMQPVEQLTPLDGEDRMWDAQSPRNLRWGRLAATIALLAGGGFLVGRSMVVQSSSGMVQPPVAPASSNAAAAAPAVTTRSSTAAACTAVAAPVAASLSRAEAAAVIGKWQAAKAAALGPKHDVKGLASILRGEVLEQWRQRAQQIQRKGWHYLHTMEGSQINSVRVEGSAAFVSATFREAVVAHRGASEPVQAFRSEYSVDYELTFEPSASSGGAWVITGATVRG